MVTAIWFFALTVSAFELTIVWKVQPLYRFITTTQYGGLIGIGFSIGLSLMIAGMFGAAGTIAMAGAVLGTIITAVVYKLRLIEATFTIYRAVRDIIRALGNFFASVRGAVIDVRDRYRSGVASTKRAYGIARHPIRTIRS
jgi:hypothetical protein